MASITSHPLYVFAQQCCCIIWSGAVQEQKKAIVNKGEVFAGWIYLLSTSDVNMEELGFTKKITVSSFDQLYVLGTWTQFQGM